MLQGRGEPKRCRQHPPDATAQPRRRRGLRAAGEANHEHHRCLTWGIPLAVRGHPSFPSAFPVQQATLRGIPWATRACRARSRCLLPSNCLELTVTGAPAASTSLSSACHEKITGDSLSQTQGLLYSALMSTDCLIFGLINLELLWYLKGGRKNGVNCYHLYLTQFSSIWPVKSLFFFLFFFFSFLEIRTVEIPSTEKQRRGAVGTQEAQQGREISGSTPGCSSPLLPLARNTAGS